MSKTNYVLKPVYHDVVESGKPFKGTFYGLVGADPVLKDNEAILLFMQDGTTKVIAGTNILGGVCDDCTCDFLNETVLHWQKVSF